VRDEDVYAWADTYPPWSWWASNVRSGVEWELELEPEPELELELRRSLVLGLGNAAIKPGQGKVKAASFRDTSVYAPRDQELSGQAEGWHFSNGSAAVAGEPWASGWVQGGWRQRPGRAEGQDCRRGGRGGADSKPCWAARNRGIGELGNWGNGELRQCVLALSGSTSSLKVTRPSCARTRRGPGTDWRHGWAASARPPPPPLPI
jgi:hypothetical protein